MSTEHIRSRVAPTALVALFAGLLALSDASAATYRIRPDQPYVSIEDFTDVLEDPEGTFEIDQVSSALSDSFLPNPPGRELNYGSTRSTYWFRFSLANDEPLPVSAVLEVGHPLLDRLELFTPLETGFRSEILGDRRPFRERILKVPPFVFPLTLAPDSRTTYFLKVSSEGTLAVPLSISASEPYFGRTAESSLWLGLFYGIFLASLLYNLFLWVSVREAIYFHLVSHTLAVGLALACVDGLAFRLWPNATEWQQWAVFVMVVFLNVSTILFVRQLMETAARAPRLDRVFKAAVWLIVGTCGLAATAGIRVLFRTSVAWLFVVGALLAGHVLFEAWRGHRPARIYSVAWVLFLLTLSFLAASGLGLVRHFEVSLTLVKIAAVAEILLAVIAVAANLSETRRALEASESKFSRAFHSSPDACTLSTVADGRFLEVNEAFEEMTGHSQTETVGRTAKELGLWGVDSRDRLVSTLEREGRIRRMRAVIVSKSGHSVPVRFSGEPIKIDGQECLVAIVHDETARHKADKLRQRLIGDLEAKNVELERFSYTVSHDLKSPLITIMGFVGLLEKDVKSRDSDKVFQDVKRIRTAAAKMGELIDNLLELSRAGRPQQFPEPVQLNVLVDQVLEVLRPRIESSQTGLAVDPDLGVVQGDPVRLQEVFQNLLDNALRYSSDRESRIEIGKRVDEDDTVYYVRDNGVGIQSEDQHAVFELFRRLSADTEGTGIGLAVVKRVVESHGGRVWVESEGRERGSTFCFTLPPDS